MCVIVTLLLKYARTSMVEHLWNHENMFETRVARANECNHRGDFMSTHNIPFSIWKKNHPKLSQICSFEICPRDPRTSSKQQWLTSHSVRATEMLLYYYGAKIMFIKIFYVHECVRRAVGLK